MNEKGGSAKTTLVANLGAGADILAELFETVCAHAANDPVWKHTGPLSV